jgi:hypothetical protein
MTAPSVPLSYFTVTQPSVVAVDTNAAAGQAPQQSWVKGTVTFTPSQRIISSESLDATVYLDVVVGYFTSDGHGLEMQNGTAGVQLIDNAGLGLAAGALTYRVNYQLDQSQNTPPFDIAAPGDGSSIDLNNPAVQIPIMS